MVSRNATLIIGGAALIGAGIIIFKSLSQPKMSTRTVMTPGTGSGTGPGTPTAGLIDITGLTVRFSGGVTQIQFDINNNTLATIPNLRLQIHIETQEFYLPDSRHDTICGPTVNSVDCGLGSPWRGLPSIPVISAGSTIRYSVAIDNAGTPERVIIRLMNPDGSLACNQCEMTACNIGGCNTIIS